MAPPEAAQEGAQSLPSRKRGVDGALTTQPMALAVPPVRNASSSMQSPLARACPAKAGGGGRQGHHLVAGVGSAGSVAQVQAPVNQLGQTQVMDQGDRQEQTGIGHQAVIVEGDLDAVGVVAWQHLLGAPFLGPVCCFKTIIPDTEERLLAASGR